MNTNIHTYICTYIRICINLEHTIEARHNRRAYKHTYIYEYIRICIHTYIHAHIIYMRAYIHMHTQEYKYTPTHVHTHAYT